MLTAIKGTISSVKDDVTQGFQSLASTASSQVQKLPRLSSTDHDTCNVKGAADINTGAELLHRYMDNWQTIHENSREIAGGAEEVDRLVESIYHAIDQQNSEMNNFLSELSAMTLLTAAMNNIHEQLGKLEKEFHSVEKGLLELEDVCEQQDMKKQFTYHESELIRHRKLKHQQLENTKAALAAKHQKKVQEMEQQMAAKLKERQIVFATAHNEQMLNYRKYGHIEVERVYRPHESEDIDSIVVEDNIHELERFLEDLDLDNGSSPSGADDKVQSFPASSESVAQCSLDHANQVDYSCDSAAGLETAVTSTVSNTPAAAAAVDSKSPVSHEQNKEYINGEHTSVLSNTEHSLVGECSNVSNSGNIQLVVANNRSDSSKLGDGASTLKAAFEEQLDVNKQGALNQNENKTSDVNQMNNENVTDVIEIACD